MTLLLKLKKFIYYYFSLSLGFTGVSWLIWSRFIRERTIRDIPDSLFTEYRFWILFYICSVYLYVIKSLIKPKNSNEILKELLEFLYKPFITFDHFIKYNKYVKPYFYIFMDKIIQLLTNTSEKQKIIIILMMQIFPRIILVMCLLLDSFYFKRLELFYKIVLIGLLPFIERYIKYFIKDIIKHHIEMLENKYESVYMMDEIKADPDIDVNILMKNKSVCKDITLQQYLNIAVEIYLNNNNAITYDFKVICKDNIYELYALNKYGDINFTLTEEDYVLLENEFNCLMPKLINFNIFLVLYQNIMEHKIIKWPKIIIFTLYLICWSYILLISYNYYPNDFEGFMILVFNYSRYLIRNIDPFNEHEEIINKNYLIINLLKLLKRIFYDEK